MQTHIVQKGDTLWKISRKYGVSFDELKRLNAHLANPEYIVPGMKIFIPEKSKKESMRHPFTDDRPVKKDMLKKEEVHIKPQTGSNMKKQQVQPVHKAQQVQPVHKAQQVQPVKKAQQMQPVPMPMPMPIQPIQMVPMAPPVQHIQQVPMAPPAPPVQNIQQIQHVQQQPQPYSMPFHIMPVPDLDMTPSPQGWRLIESTSIHINIHNESSEKEESPIKHMPAMEPSPQFVSPAMEEVSSEFEEMEPFEEYPQMQHFEHYQPMNPCGCMDQQMQPYMQPQMHPHMDQQMQPYMQAPMQQHMQPWSGHPYVHVCFVPVCTCPPHPYQHF
ncbi:SafA/ExsA family spore coat assembly protein [Psychrobacillus sp. FJAT-51614]|uniref:SafA/ExsA family spore coat assembly protein n=1 Tax=Psychrobacillus mangrovi TaxID=3117745 RepID=A0ABU8F3B1_9BACI